MAEYQKPDRPESAAAEPPVSHPHDKYFYSVFSDTRNAADLLLPYLPQVRLPAAPVVADEAAGHMGER